MSRFAMRAALLGALLAGTASAPVLAQTAPAAAPAAAPQGLMVGPALYVSDYRKSLRFYTDGLGMQLRMRFGPVDQPDLVVGYGGDPTQPGIMLLTDKDGPTPRPIGHVHGFDRIAYRIPNIAAIGERLRKAGFTPGEVRVAHNVIQVMMVSDPDGYTLELIDTNPAPKKP